MSTPKQRPVFLGLDLGTGGVRAIAATETGEVIAQSTVSLDNAIIRTEAGRHEQDPAQWWRSACEALQSLTASLGALSISEESLKAIAVDGTSGTLVCLDADGIPVRPAIMYNDGRSTEEAADLTAAAGDFCKKLGYRFEPSYALSKALWFFRHEASAFDRTCRFLHQGDFVAGRLAGDFSTSDYSNALKTGYDLVEERWPEWLATFDEIHERLPRVVAPATVVGGVSRKAAEETGLPVGLAIASGATDGTAACIASGMRTPGDYNTTLGTTLVFKGIAREICRHPQGLIYSHKLPGGLWLPGAASNTGGEWITSWFGDADPAALDRQAAGLLPVDHLAYPLARTGERFPFLAPDAEGFCEPEAPSKVLRYAAYLQGTALVERLAYNVLDRVAGTSGGSVYCTGGGTRSEVWSQCRADVTGRCLHLPACPESAFGSAVLAAASVHFDGVWEAVEAMVRIDRTFEANGTRTSQYDDLFGRFLNLLSERKYV